MKSLSHTHTHTHKHRQEHIETKMCPAFLPELVILFILNLFFSCIYSTVRLPSLSLPERTMLRASDTNRFTVVSRFLALAIFPSLHLLTSLSQSSPIISASFFFSLTLFCQVKFKSLTKNFLTPCVVQSLAIISSLNFGASINTYDFESSAPANKIHLTTLLLLFLCACRSIIKKQLETHPPSTHS